MAPLCPLSEIVLLSRALGLVFLPFLALACTDVPPPSVAPPERGAYCYEAFSPDEAVRLDVELAAIRWGAATGCDIDVSDAGVPVALVASIVRPDGSEAPGWTSDARDLVEVNAKSRAAQRTSAVLHEMGHALGGDHTASHGVLSGDKGRADVIDVAALESVCSRLPCRLLSPEAP